MLLNIKIIDLYPIQLTVKARITISQLKAAIEMTGHPAIDYIIFGGKVLSSESTLHDAKMGEGAQVYAMTHDMAKHSDWIDIFAPHSSDLPIKARLFVKVITEKLVEVPYHAGDTIERSR